MSMFGVADLVQRLHTHPSVLGQGARFVITGVVVTLCYLSVTTLLSTLVGLPFQVALALGFCVALAVHFTLQRFFVWAHHEFALPLHHQLTRYLLVTGTQYCITAIATALLPSVLQLPPEIVFLGTTAVLASANFLLFRHSVFHPVANGASPASGLPLKTA